MSGATADALADAILAIRLCGQEQKLGGLRLIGGDAHTRAAVITALAEILPPGAPVRRVPSTIDEDRLVGGLDLAAALAGGSVRARPGLLAEVDGGAIVLPAAERLPPVIEALIGAALDRGEVVMARDGFATRTPARFLVVACDEDATIDRAPRLLDERLAFHLRLDQPPVPDEATVDDAIGEDDILQIIASTAAALGVESTRASIFALKAAQASAAIEGRDAIVHADLARAVRLVLVPRATRLPPEPAEAAPEEQRAEDGGHEQEHESETGTLEDRVIAAARAAIDPHLLARIAAGRTSRSEGRRARGAGDRRRSRTRGRPIGTRAGEPRGGARLALVATLRAAAPWQRLRGREDRVIVHASDLRIRRYQARAALCTIFAVDASGSTAASRLAEAKGAIELLLAQAYVQRAEVALLAFRGAGAETLLPPTRSLTRARRALADLPGGGGTPLAHGIAGGHAIASAVRAKGSTPFLVLLSDGRGNVAADGKGDRLAANRDAIQAARLVAADRVPTVFIDTSPRARPEGARLAEALGARYVPLPYADASAVEAAVSASAPRR